MAMLVFSDQLAADVEKELESHFSHIMSRHIYTHTQTFKGSMTCLIWQNILQAPCEDGVNSYVTL